MARIQNIELRQNPLHKFFHLSELHRNGWLIQEGLLSVLRIEEAQHPRDQIIEKRKTPEQQQHTESSLTLNTIDLLLYGVTSNQGYGCGLVRNRIRSSVVNPRTAQEIASNISLQNASESSYFLVYHGLVLSTSRHATPLIFAKLDRPQPSNHRRFDHKSRDSKKKVQLAMLVEPWLRRLVGYGTSY